MQTTLPRLRRGSVISMAEASREHAERRQRIVVEADIKCQCEEAVEAALSDPAFQTDAGLGL